MQTHNLQTHANTRKNTTCLPVDTGATAGVDTRKHTQTQTQTQTRSTTCLPVDTGVLAGHMQTHSDTIGKWTNIIIIRNTNTKFADTKTDTHTNE